MRRRRYEIRPGPDSLQPKVSLVLERALFHAEQGKAEYLGSPSMHRQEERVITSALLLTCKCFDSGCLFAPRGEIIPSPVITTPEENVHTRCVHVARPRARSLSALSGDLKRAQLVRLKVLKDPLHETTALKFPCTTERHSRVKYCGCFT